MTYLETVSSLILKRLKMKISDAGKENPYSKFPALQALSSSLSDGDIKKWADAEDVLSDPKALKAHPDIEVRRYGSLLALLDNDNVLRSLLDLSIACFNLPSLSACLTSVFGYSVNLHLAFMLEDIPFPKETEVLEKARLAALICRVDLTASPVQYSELVIDERIMSFLSGDDALNPVLSSFVTFFPSDSYLNKPYVNNGLIESGTSFFKKGGRALQISGKGGRRFIACHISAKDSKNLLLINIAELTDVSADEFENRKQALIREAVLSSCDICIYGITNDLFLPERGRGSLRQSLPVLEQRLFLPVLQYSLRLILCTDSPHLLITSLPEADFSLIELPEGLSYDERLSLWTGLKKEYNLKIDAEAFAIRYHLNASEAAKAVRSFTERVCENDDPERLFSRIVMQGIDESPESIGRIIYSRIRLEDVKLKSRLKEVLNDVITSVRTAHTVLDSWELRKNYHYGTAVSLLLSGPPGTGKTMTANAIAGELGFPLFQVNLSHIVDKYIGETEKNLEKAFAFAEKTNSVLFFDEADSLFGKRSEVKDSHDKYANNEISYLLQRIEAYDGIVILSTNIKGNIDPAFLRRLRYVVHFENPDKEARRAIWESCFDAAVPHEDIDIDYLSEQFDEFTGSVIRTVFLNACSLAAGKNEPLSMSHLIRAIRLELEKTSTVAFSGDTLGKYAYLS